MERIRFWVGDLGRVWTIRRDVQTTSKGSENVATYLLSKGDTIGTVRGRSGRRSFVSSPSRSAP